MKPTPVNMKKLPNIVIYACDNITEKMNLIKMCVPQIRLCLFTFRPVASKRCNSLNGIYSLSWLSCAEETHPLWVREVLGSIPGSDKSFLFCCCCVFTFWSKHTLFVTQFCNFFCNVNSFGILNKLQDLWPIIMVLRYRPSILNTNEALYTFT